MIPVVLIALIPLAIAPGSDDPYFLPKNAAIMIVAAMSWARLLYLGRFPKTNADVAGCGMVFAAGAIWTGYRNGAMAGSVWTCAIVVAWALLACIVASYEKPEERRFFARALTYSAALQVMFGLIQIAIGGLSAKLLFRGALGNPEVLATFLAASYLIVRHERPFNDRRDHFFCLWLLLGIALTLSRVNWICLAAVEFWSAARPKTRWIVFAATCAASAALVIGRISGVAPEALYSTETIRGRAFVGRVALRVASSSNWLGSGFGELRHRYVEAQGEMFTRGGWDAFFDRAAQTPRAHDELIDLLAEGGIACLLAAVWMYWHVARSRAAPHPVWLLLGITALATFPAHSPATAVALLLPASACFGVAPKKEHGRWNRAAFALFLLLLASFGLDAARINFQLGRSFRFATANDLNAAKNAIARACPSNLFRHECAMAEGRLRFLSGDAAGARTILLPEVRSGGTVDAMKLLALAQEASGDLLGAEQTYSRLAASFPRHVTPQFRLGVLAAKSCRKESARTYLLRALQNPAKSAKARRDQELAQELLDSLDSTRCPASGK